jgi:hypothetical protein
MFIFFTKNEVDPQNTRQIKAKKQKKSGLLAFFVD